MARQKPIEVISPPNMLKAKIGGPMPALDKKAIARAEAELAKMADQFVEWIEEEVKNLNIAWAAFEADPTAETTTKELHRRSHDLKGLAPTYGYPLIGRVCNTLCKLTADDIGDIKIPQALLKAHVDAVKAMVAGDIKAADHPVGTQLAGELEMQTLKVLTPEG